MDKRKFKHINKTTLKKDGLGLAIGENKFTDDYYLPGMLHIAVLRSPHAYAKIKKLDDSAARALPGVVDIYSCNNIKRIMYTTAGQGYPEPSAYDCVLFNDTMRYVGDQAAAVVAESPDIAEEALKLIKVDYEVLEPLLDYTKALDEGAVRVHTEPDARMIIPMPYDASKNTCADIKAVVGDFEAGLKKAKKQFTFTTESQSASHCALEAHSAVAWIDEYGRMTIVSTSQVPWHARRITAMILEIPVRDVRVIKPRIGGGFGGKQEIIVEPLVGLATWRTKRPSKITFSRRDVFMSGRRRHGQNNTVTIGYDPATGMIDALRVYALENAGAYGSHAVTILTNTATKVLPMINHVPNIEFIGKGVYANLQVGGAYRGYGATEGCFTYCQAIDILAHDIGMDPVEYYRKYAIKSGGTSEIFAKLGEGTEGGAEMTIDSCGLIKAMEMAGSAIKWEEKRKLYTPEYNKGKRVWRGIGMTCLLQGSAVPKVDMGSAYIKMNDDGSFNLHLGATDIGTGSDTIMAQIVAEELDCPVENIIVLSSDTDLTPFDVGAYASSTTYLSGEAVRKAAVMVKEQILHVGAEMLALSPEDVETLDNKVVQKGGEKFKTFADIGTYSLYTHHQLQIQGFGSHVVDKSPPPFAAHFAEIEVDTETGDIKVLEYTSATDCGTAINPLFAEGQVDGAVVNGLSYALTEGYIYNDKGVLRNPSFTTYKIYTAPDIPPMKNMIVPDSYEHSGPFGAKSVSELGINGPMPVIANAFFNATGKRLCKAPFTPEYVLSVLKD
ncbi:MAG: molybdopterin-dependent oxidoreductase [Spirochaetota bacterium]|jgi:CO/xanthine dehydrogenase Mo-binding subunit|nr:molybdopterin-dependent oxidoreductase [Spirochaetota bacterium]